MFANFSLSWQFAKMSYKEVWQEKRLLIFLLVALVAGALVWLGFMAGTQVTVYMAFAVAVIMFLLVASLSAAAGMVFKSMLYAYATGKQLPAMIEPEAFANAFHPAE